MRILVLVLLGFLLCPTLCSAAERRGHLETEDLPAWLRDRGEGVPTSMFGTYVQEGQLLVYPFFEYYRDADFEYKPSELGYSGDSDYRGKYRASEGLIWLCYGVSERLALELEAAVISAELEKRSGDAPGVPGRIEESGLGDVEGNLRWRWAPETATRPEVFSYFESVVPTQEKGSLIGTTEWEFKLGSGVTRGLSSGTWTVRAAVGYNSSESKLEMDEAALEYLKRLSPSWRIYSGLEGIQDEWELITEAQWHVSSDVFLKLNNAFGLTSKATDWAPEVGVVFSF